MALGKPAVATAYSGNLEFMNDGNSYLVPGELVPIPAGLEPYTAGGCWVNRSGRRRKQRSFQWAVRNEIARRGDHRADQSHQGARKDKQVIRGVDE